MRRIRITLRVLVVVIAGMFLHYVLPQHDIVRITNTDTIRTDFSSLNRIFYAQADSGNAEQINRDIRYIYSDRQKTFLFGLIKRDSMGVMVYRNEDTGWIWPPYFKFDSSNLQAQAASQAQVSSQNAGSGWSVVTHYGWRIPFLSIFPNAVDIRPVDGPDVRIIPWFNIFFFVFLIATIVFIRAMWAQLRERSVDPLLDSAGDQFDVVQAGVAERRGRLTRWLNTWRPKDKRR